MHQTLALRPVVAEDTQLLYRIYASTRQEELAQVEWGAGQKEAFLQMQFQAQQRHYQQHYAAAQFQVILLDGQPAGRLYLDRGASEIRIVDIALLPEYRNRGVGSTLLREILAAGQRCGLAVAIHVECFNPALRLYQRLGFHKAEDRGVYYFMQKLPDLAQALVGQA